MYVDQYPAWPMGKAPHAFSSTRKFLPVSFEIYNVLLTFIVVLASAIIMDQYPG